MPRVKGGRRNTREQETTCGRVGGGWAVSDGVPFYSIPHWPHNFPKATTGSHRLCDADGLPASPQQQVDTRTCRHPHGALPGGACHIHGTSTEHQDMSARACSFLLHLSSHGRLNGLACAICSDEARPQWGFDVAVEHQQQLCRRSKNWAIADIHRVIHLCRGRAGPSRVRARV